MEVKYRDHFFWSLKRLKETPELDWEEVMECIDKAIRFIERNPDHAAELKRSPLIGYQSHHFFSMLNPPEGMQPDMRLIYRVVDDTLYLEVVGLRRQKEKLLDIYTLFEELISHYPSMKDPGRWNQRERYRRRIRRYRRRDE